MISTILYHSVDIGEAGIIRMIEIIVICHIFCFRLGDIVQYGIEAQWRIVNLHPFLIDLFQEMFSDELQSLFFTIDIYDFLEVHLDDAVMDQGRRLHIDNQFMACRIFDGLFVLRK